MLFRSVSRFWLYLVLILGGIALLPLYYNIKTESFLPLATLYRNQLQGWEWVLLWHVIASILGAGLIFSVDRFVVGRFFQGNAHSSAEEAPNHETRSND
jgi:hypothetical protein